ncbi:MAG: hypothetical protein M1839_004931 [Geoglossum umbratile]|nr:MAG: hypothetical protein M1839_004931 [Geoglossum umbratile]
MVLLGVEIEILLASRPDELEASDLNDFAELFSKAFSAETTGRFRMHADVYGYNGPNALVEWTVTDNATLDTNQDDQWPVEIISPILRYEVGYWRQDVSQLWDTLNLLCLADTNDSCSTHVHMSLGYEPWGVHHLKRIGYCVIYFENAFEMLAPEERRQNEYAKSNRHDNPRFLGKSDDECYRMIDACTSVSDIVHLFNNGEDRYFAWNFTNLLQGGIMTVEFRRGPGVTTEEACLSWVELPASFIQVACKMVTISDLNRYPATVEGLLSFISEFPEPGAYRPQNLATIFEGKSGSLVPTPIGELSASSQERLARKKPRDDLKGLMAKKFLRLL